MTPVIGVAIGSSAESDLRDIVDYLTVVRGGDEAARFVDEMLDRIGGLSQFPNRGSIPREIDDSGQTDIRQTLYGKYRIVYEVAPEQVTIVLVADGRRDMAALLRERVLGGDALA